MVLLSSTVRALSYGSSYLGKKKGKRKIMQGNIKFMKQESGSSSNKTKTCHKRTWILHRTGEQQTLTANSPSHGEAVQMCSLSVSVSKVAYWDMVDTKNWARPWNRRGPLAEGLIMSRRSTRKCEILIYCQDRDELWVRDLMGCIPMLFQKNPFTERIFRKRLEQLKVMSSQSRVLGLTRRLRMERWPWDSEKHTQFEVSWWILVSTPVFSMTNCVLKQKS